MNKSANRYSINDRINLALSPLDSFIKMMNEASDGHPAAEVAETLMEHAKTKINNITDFVDQKIGRIKLVSAAENDDALEEAELIE